MDLIDEEHVLWLEIGKYCCQIARSFQSGTRCHPDRNTFLGSDDRGQGGLAQTRRTGEENVIERSAFLGGGFEGDPEPVLDFGLPDELVEVSRSKRELLFVLDRRAEQILSRGVGRPLQAMTEAMRKLAEGDKAIDVPHRERGDEIGAMASAVDVFKQNAIEMERLEMAQARAKEHAEESRRQAMFELADDFEVSVKGVRIIGVEEQVLVADQLNH